MKTVYNHVYRTATLVLIAGAVCVSAQEENERLAAGIPLENSIANRDLAFRWRSEVQNTQDSDDLLTEDPALAFYPERMYTTELKMFAVNGATAYGMYDHWQNDQELDVFRASGGIGVPVGEAWRVDTKALYFDREEATDSQFYYLSAGRSLGNFYTYSQYRYSVDGRDVDNGITQGHQASEYLSWSPVKTFRMGGQVAYNVKENGDDSSYGRIFTSVSFFDYRTSIRLEAFDYESLVYTDYREFKAYLYQKLTRQAMIRLQYRYYTDDASRESHAPGLKLMYFFCPRMVGHIGYVRYEQNDSADFDSYLAGMSIVF